MISLNVTKLSKFFGPHTVFSDISFEHRQKALGIAGSNGSGKSTFLKCLAGLLRPSAGSVEWQADGDALNKNELKKMMGYAAPYINLYDELSCKENLVFLSKMRHDTVDDNRIRRWITNVDLKAVSGQPFGTLSTGQQQRLRLAAALFYEPKILLLDEPGSNLDEAGRSLINDIAASYQSNEMLLIIASNNPDELTLCDRIFSIEEEAFV